MFNYHRWGGPAFAVRRRLISGVAYLLFYFAVFYCAPSIAGQCVYAPVTTVACDGAHAPGVVSVPINQRQHVGNPIDVVTGAKQQREIDFQSMGSALHFSRYYHSGRTDHNIGLGQGWRHTYSVSLYLVDESHLQIQQADGRWIDFYALPASTETEKSLYMADKLMDGYIVKEPKPSWYLPDGRVLRFHGSHLTHIEYANGDSLTLHYLYNRLKAVVDGTGSVLRFEYADASNDLPIYDSTLTPSFTGALTELQLPSEQSIEFEYDRQRNLHKALYPNQQSKWYHYRQSGFANHLTSIVEYSQDDLQTRRWRYDVNGKVVGYDGADSMHSIALEYGEVADLTEGITTVKYKAGRIEHYHWHRADPIQQPRITQLSVQECEHCKREVLVLDKPTVQIAVPVLNDVGRREPNSKQVQSRDKSEQITRSQLYQFPDRDQLIPIPESLDKGVQLVVDGVLHEFVIRLNRLGEVIDIEVGNTSLNKLKDKWAEGKLDRCDGAVLLEQSRSRSAPDVACIEDLVYLLDLELHLQKLASEYDGKNGLPEQRSSQASNLCLVNPYQTCAELERAFMLAQLSSCAYVVAMTPCGSQWQLVDPTQLGLLDEQFNNGSFSASLYFNSQTNEYVLVFRGTDDLADWKDNLLQAMGNSTSQYRQAVALAQSINLLLPNATLTVTGHSLGGGLASAAALSINAPATVFNPAALHPATADQLGLVYANAQVLIDVTTVDGDLLTRVQTPSVSQGTTRYTAPGEHRVLMPPSDVWVDYDNLNASTPMPESVVLHSIRAVLQAAENILRAVCGIIPERA